MITHIQIASLSRQQEAGRLSDDICENSFNQHSSP